MEAVLYTLYIFGFYMNRHIEFLNYLDICLYKLIILMFMFQIFGNSPFSASNGTLPCAAGIDRNNTSTGEDLWCYECSESYKTKFNVSDSPCLNNLTRINVRQCSGVDNYCKVIYMSVCGYGWLWVGGCVCVWGSWVYVRSGG